MAVSTVAVLLSLCTGALAQRGSDGPTITRPNLIRIGVLRGADFRAGTINVRDLAPGVRDALSRDLIAVRVGADGRIDTARSVGFNLVRTGRVVTDLTGQEREDTGFYCFELIGSDPIHVQAVAEQADFTNDDAVINVTVRPPGVLRQHCPPGVDDGMVSMRVQREFITGTETDPRFPDFIRPSEAKPFYLVFVR